MSQKLQEIDMFLLTTFLLLNLKKETSRQIIFLAIICQTIFVFFIIVFSGRGGQGQGEEEGREVGKLFGGRRPSK